VYGSGLTGGAGGHCAQPQNGPGGVSGSGERPSSGAGTGGGGGGLTGGDGGASGGPSGGGAGGGGAGSSFWSSVTSNALVTNHGPGHGLVIVSWTPDPPAGITQSVSFSGCCAPQHFTVPAGVTQLTVTGWGASGGAGGGNDEGVIASRGGYGAVVRELVAVNPGDNLAIETGGAGGDGGYAAPGARTVPIAGGTGGPANIGASGGQGGYITAKAGDSGSYYAGGTGGGGGGATLVLNTTSSTLLLNAGGGGGGGGDSGAAFGDNGGPGGNAGSPLVTANNGDGDGYFGSGGSTPGQSNGSGGRYASASSANGEGAANSTTTNVRGTGGGGGGGVIGGGAGQQCTGFNCALSGGGGAAGSSAWVSSAQAVLLGNSLAGGGGVRISWFAPVATATTIGASAKTVVAGTPLTLTATVTGSEARAGDALNGTVTFVDADTGLPLGSPVALSPASPSTARLTTTLPAGTDHVYARYSGDRVFGPSTSPPLTEDVIPQLSVTTTSLPGVEVGAPYSAKLTAGGGVAPYTWSLSSGALPAGLRLDASTGEITGTPTATGTAGFTVHVTDTGVARQTADEPLSLAVRASTLAISAVTRTKSHQEPRTSRSA
jgi:hypothetical protein